MKKMLISLGFSQPPSNVTATEIWTKIETKCQELLSKLPKGYLGKPIFTAMLNNAQWKQLMQINQALTEDFQMRRELLLTRIDVTIQSFKWADRLKANSSEIATIYQQKRKELSFRPSVKLYYILAARDGKLRNKKLLKIVIFILWDGMGL
jgi:protein FAM98B